MREEVHLSMEDKKWIEESWQAIQDKIEWVSKRTKQMIPYTTDSKGRYQDIFKEIPAMWTNGFWAGTMWLMYQETKQESYKEDALAMEVMLDDVLYLKNGLVEKLDHDVGFLWHLSGVAEYRITGNPDGHRRGIIASNYLMARFNPKGGFLTAWNSKEREGWSIIDTMMNLPLLYWAFKETGMQRYRDVAIAHAQKTMQYLIRPDGSSAHIAVYNVETGEFIEHKAGQGAHEDSSWTRGQGWAIYGFALSYRYTKNPEFLHTAKKVAHYYLASYEDYNRIPPSDFRGDQNKKLMDTTSAVIAANGLIEISNYVSESEKRFYYNAALSLLKDMIENYCDFSDQSDAILQKSSERYTDEKEMTIIYGDFFLLEAVLKLKGSEFFIW